MRAFVVCVTLALLACAAPPPRTGSPADALPPHITRLLETGLRPDWSGDGERLLFLDALVGDVFEVAIATGAVRPWTTHFAHAGFTRARYLANGDLLLCGPPLESDPEDEARRWHTELFHLAASRDRPATPLGEPCFEGPAVSRRSLRIAWNVSDYPDSVVFGRSEIWTGELELDGGAPRLVAKRKVVDRSDFFYLGFLETQDFRPPDDRELIFTAYAWRGGEVMTVDLASGALRNHSRNAGYDEAEGVFPDGGSVVVEREPGTWTAVPRGDIDLWRTKLDGSAESQRLTFFSDFPGYGANNPVVSPDGRFMAFCLREREGPHGNGHGVFLYDFARAAESMRVPSH